MTKGNPVVAPLRLVVTFAAEQEKRLKRLRSMLGAENLGVAAQIATMHGIDRLMIDLPCRGPAAAKVHHRIPAQLWERLRSVAKQNGNSANEEIIAAVAHWVSEAEKKKGGAPA